MRYGWKGEADGLTYGEVTDGMVSMRITGRDRGTYTMMSKSYRESTMGRGDFLVNGNE